MAAQKGVGAGLPAVWRPRGWCECRRSGLGLALGQDSQGRIHGWEPGTVWEQQAVGSGQVTDGSQAGRIAQPYALSGHLWSTCWGQEQQEALNTAEKPMAWSLALWS